MIISRGKLIPRNNWDYALSDCVKASIASIKGRTSTADGHFGKIFDRKPIMTTSGRTSLYAILKSLNIRPGSHVGIPLFCCDVVFEAIKKANLEPRFIDVNMEDYNLSVSDLKKKKKTLAAVVVLHMFGNPADMDAIRTVCGHIPIIEDCAHSLFSKYKGVYTGLLGTASFFSFRSGKYISAGEGSAILTSDSVLRESIERLVDSFDRSTMRQEILHCLATHIKATLYHRPWYGMLGYPIGTRLDTKLNLTAKSGFTTGKIRLGDLQILNERIDTFPAKIQKQRENSLYLLDRIRMSDIYLPRENNECFSNYYQFAVRFKQPEKRDLISDALFARGIDTARYLSDIADIARHRYKYDGDCVNAELCARSTLIIPNHYTLSPLDLEFIVNSLNSLESF